MSTPLAIQPLGGNRHFDFSSVVLSLVLPVLVHRVRVDSSSHSLCVYSGGMWWGVCVGGVSPGNCPLVVRGRGGVFPWGGRTRGVEGINILFIASTRLPGDGKYLIAMCILESPWASISALGIFLGHF